MGFSADERSENLRAATEVAKLRREKGLRPRFGLKVFDFKVNVNWLKIRLVLVVRAEFNRVRYYSRKIAGRVCRRTPKLQTQE